MFLIVLKLSQKHLKLVDIAMVFTMNLASQCFWETQLRPFQDYFCPIIKC